jgi:hypothetical protein
VQKRPQPKVAAARATTESATRPSRTAASRSKSARLLQLVEAQIAAHELLDQLGAAQNQQQLRRSIGAAAAQQIRRLTKLLDQLRTEPQRNQQLQRLLTDEQYASYVNMLEQPTSSADILMQDGIPSELQQYQDMISAADKINALADGARTRSRRSGNVNAARKHRQRAEKLYEDACMWLDGVLNKADPQTEMSIRAWLDRDFDYSAGGNIGIDCVGVARIRGSSSQHCLIKSRYDRAERKTVQHERQLDAVAAALQDLIYTEPAVQTVAAPVVSAKLQALLRVRDDGELF